MNTLQISGKVVKADYHNDQCVMIVLDTLEDGLELNVESHNVVIHEGDYIIAIGRLQNIIEKLVGSRSTVEVKILAVAVEKLEIIQQASSKNSSQVAGLEKKESVGVVKSDQQNSQPASNFDQQVTESSDKNIPQNQSNDQHIMSDNSQPTHHENENFKPHDVKNHQQLVGSNSNSGHFSNGENQTTASSHSQNFQESSEGDFLTEDEIDALRQGGYDPDEDIHAGSQVVSPEQTFEVNEDDYKAENQVYAESGAGTNDMMGCY